VVINLSGPGACVMGIVRKDGFDVVDRCAGCKADQPTYHTRSRCPLSRLEGQLIPSLRGRRRAAYGLPDPNLLAGQTRTIRAGKAAGIEIDAEFVPPVGGSAGLRIGQDERLDVEYNGTVLTVAGAPIPLLLRPNEKAIRLHMQVSKTSFTLYANSLVTLTRRLDVDNPSLVTAFAAEGPAFFKALTVWELR